MISIRSICVIEVCWFICRLVRCLDRVSRDPCVRELSGCDYLRKINSPDGYASNIARCVTESNKLAGMKSHYYHDLLQKLLLVGILTLLTSQLHRTLIELSQFFEKLCARTLDVRQLTEMRRGIVIILCKLEKYFSSIIFYSYCPYVCTLT